VAAHLGQEWVRSQARVAFTRVLKRLEGKRSGVERRLLERRHWRQGSQMPKDLEEQGKGSMLLTTPATRSAASLSSGGGRRLQWRSNMSERS
jgi:hypothetical protein